MFCTCCGRPMDYKTSLDTIDNKRIEIWYCRYKDCFLFDKPRTYIIDLEDLKWGTKRDNGFIGTTNTGT